MCLLIASLPQSPVSIERIESAATANPDGIGIAYPYRKGMSRYVSIAPGSREFAEISRISENEPSIIHFRFATHGTRTPDNLHPFLSPCRRYALAHNGVFHGLPHEKFRSDTRIFAEDIVFPILARRDLEDVWPVIEDACGGQKVCIMDWKTGEIYIAGEDGGHYDGCTWYSNTSYAGFRDRGGRAFTWDDELEEEETRVPKDADESLRHLFEF